MKGNVFIGWSSDNSLAKKVKEKLKPYGYNGVVGGRAEDMLAHGVGDTVIKQMKSCCAAIMLFTTRRSDDLKCGSCGKELANVKLSGNMLFELGFLTGSLRIKRVFIVYVDDAVSLVPTDLKGMWDLRVSSAEKSEDELAAEIAGLFSNEQNEGLVDVKIDLVADYYSLKNKIVEHLQNPVYYESEMAQIILMYARSAYLFGNTASASDFLGDVLHSNVNDEGILLAVNSSLSYFGICEALDTLGEGNTYLPRKAYSKYSKELKSYLEDAEELDEKDPLRLMLEMTVKSTLCFADMMYYRGVEKDEDYYEMQIEDCEAALNAASRFEQADIVKNELFGVLYESYAYRNLAFLNHDYGKKEEANEAFELSKTARYKILKYFRNKDLDVTALSQAETEYYLALTDNIDAVDEVEKKKRVRELKDYIAEVRELSYNREYLVRKIEKILTDATEA